jgi:hypothetical protein
MVAMQTTGGVDEVNAGDLAELGDSIPNSQNGNPSKINPEKVACFSSPNPDHQLTSFHQQSTTTSPQKNHVQSPVFAKTPSKNKAPPPQKITAEAPLVEQGFASFRAMTTAATLSWSSRSRTLAPPNPRKLSDDGECSRDVQKPQCPEVSMENEASPNSLILWGFSRVLRGLTGGEWGIRTPDRAFDPITV